MYVNAVLNFYSDFRHFQRKLPLRDCPKNRWSCEGWVTFFSKLARWRPTPVLKINSFIDILQAFLLNFNQHWIAFWSFQNTFLIFPITANDSSGKYNRSSNVILYACKNWILVEFQVFQGDDIVCGSTWYLPLPICTKSIPLTLLNLNSFVPNAPFLYPLKTSGNLKVLWYFQGVEKGCIGKEWVKVYFFLGRRVGLFIGV